ncbi:transposase [Streptomyces sp. NPDC029554]|uniref:transposase n=1 Tax=Streptomyces sp. NPDC029554 TaxID=3155126 RepID=UPI0033D57B4F
MNPARQRGGPRPDSEVFLDVVAQARLAGWCRVPVGHLAWALPSFAAGGGALAGYGRDGQGWARWRTGPNQWGPVVFGCRLCVARRGDAAGAGPVWVYRARWRRLCVRHGRWLLDVGEGHPLKELDVGAMATVLGRAQRRWAYLARRSLGAGGVGGAPGEVFTLARAVVCFWWEQEEFWERETVWGRRVEQVVAATRRRSADPAGWEGAQWRLLVRDAVTFPEVVAVARAVVDPRMQQLAAEGGSGALVRRGDDGGRVAAALGERLGRPWPGEVGAGERSGPLAAWGQAVDRERRRPAGSAPGQGRYGVWWVRAVHRPVEVGAGLRMLADAGGAGPGRGGDPGAAGGWREEPAVPRRIGHGWGLQQYQARLFAEGLEQARLQVDRYGHLAVAHAGGRVREGFDLGRWLANRRANAASMTVQQTAQLEELDPWWNPPWPLDWQRAWYRARDHVRVHGPVQAGDNLATVPRWCERWLRHQITHYAQLHEDQQRLLAELGLSRSEVERFHAWPGRRRPPADGLATARAYAARHGHLAISRPTRVDDFALGTWLSNVRHRQRSAGRPTRLGRQLSAVDAWWNPPWPIAWQRMWWTSLHHLNGLGKDLQWWPGAPDAEHTAAWLQQQHARRPLLHPGQQQLVDDLVALTGSAPLWQPRISDTAWQTLSHLLPAPRPHPGGRPRSERQILEAILHIACTRQTWPHLPAALGPSQACRRRFLRWREDGTLNRICGAVLPEQDRHWQQRLTAYTASGS